MKIKWLRTFLKFFLHYYILEKLSLGDGAAATLVTLYFFLVLVHALTAQTVLQTSDLRKGNGHINEAIDQEQNQTAEHQETLHLEFCCVGALESGWPCAWHCLQELHQTPWEPLGRGPSGCRPARQTPECMLLAPCPQRREASLIKHSVLSYRSKVKPQDPL